LTRAAALALTAILLAAAPAAAREQTGAMGENSVKNPILAAQRLMVRQKYPEATAQIRAILKTDPGNIDALHALVTIEQTRILDYEAYTIYGRRFQTFADSLLKILEAKQPALRGDDSLRCVFYRANIIGGIGLMQAKRGAWIEGARSGMASANLYRQIKKIDPNHLGADLGLGVFDYYFGTSLRWIPFVAGGSAEKGIEALERALHAPFPYNHGTKSSYCWILIDRKQFKKADSLAYSALREVPGSTIFIRIRALIALWTGNNEDALNYAGKLAAASQSRSPINWSDLITAYSTIASAHDEMGQNSEALATANKALDLPVPEAYRAMSHIKDHYKTLNGIRSKHSRTRR
jgi:tetratricopeptide (TPR) repeat protein